jgi:hypothetical protein
VRSQKKAWTRWFLGLALVALVAAGCSSDDSGDDEESSDTTAAVEETTTTAPPETTTTVAAEVPGEAQCAESTPDCTGSVTPAEGLADGDEISIEAGGFDPNLALGITQCASETDPDNDFDTTGADQCNLRAIGQVTSDADGNVTGTYVVSAGQTMIDNTAGGVTCDAEHDCVVSVGELVPDADAQRVTFLLTFA